MHTLLHTRIKPIYIYIDYACIIFLINSIKYELSEDLSTFSFKVYVIY